MNPFEYRKPKDEATAAQIEAIRAAYKAMYDNLMSLPESRYRSLSVTNLEQSAMWAIKGLVFQD